MPKSSPSMAVKEVGDLVLRDNFRLLQQYFDVENQLLRFKHLSFTVSTNEANIKISHTLGYIPRDIIVTRLLAPTAAKLVVNHGLSDNSDLDITVTGLAAGQSLKCRMFVGAYWQDDTSDNLVETDTQEFKAHY